MQTFIVDISSKEQRLDKFVSASLSISRSMAQSLLDAGKVLVNDNPRPQAYRVQEGDVIQVDLDARESLFYKRYDRSLDIPVVYEDEDIIVIDKPAGLAVHPAGVPQGDTVIEALTTMGKTLFSYDEKRKEIGRAHV